MERAARKPPATPGCALPRQLLLRHEFRRLLPSDLSKPGAFGRLHVPTGDTQYASATEKAQLSVLFGRDGCHHCGAACHGWKRSGVVA